MKKLKEICLLAILLLFISVKVCRCEQNSNNSLKILKNDNSDIIARRIRVIGKWLYNKWPAIRAEVGRCAGIGLRKIQFLFIPLFFKLGIIITILVFLTFFTMKGLGIGLILLMMNFGSLFAKFHLAKFGLLAASLLSKKHVKNVHLHMHGSQHDYHPPPPLYHGHEPPPHWSEFEDTAPGGSYPYRRNDYESSNLNGITTGSEQGLYSGMIEAFIRR